MKHSLLLPFLSGWDVLQHRPQVGEKRGSLIRLLTEARQEGPSWSYETCYPIRSGGPGESCLSAERLPEGSLISGMTSETFSCKPNTSMLKKQKQLFFIKAFIKRGFRFTAK